MGNENQHVPKNRLHGLRSVWRVLRPFVWRAAALAGSFVLFLLVMVAGAGLYTSRPEFCRSCHTMEPYYQSWAKSSHAEVSCIECHFAPGFGGKVRGKMLGLVQLAKYVTASAGPRPSAEISDASCLRSGCHETRLLSGRVNLREFPGITFDHAPHLKETRRAKKLRCTSCHSQIVQGKHMTVTMTTCFLCHFKGEHFNEGLGACTHCHQIPNKAFDLGGGVSFTHELAYEKGVDCQNCHGDVIRGTGAVPRERCLVCHNREDDLKQIDNHEFMHEKHVTEHKVDCLECHLAIHHSLERDKIEHAAGDCTSCHPDHHREQVSMLRGIGAKSIDASPSAMIASRAECRTCHRVKQVSSTGTVLWKASAQMCALCHDTATVASLEAYHNKLRESLPELESAIERAGKALPSAKLPADRQQALSARLDEIRHDLDFLRTANDIHNLHYAHKLFRTLIDRTTESCRELKVEAPKIELPPPMPKNGHNGKNGHGPAAGEQEKSSPAGNRKS